MLDKEDVWDAHSEKIKDFFDFVVKNSFPNSRIQTSTSWGSPTYPPNSFEGIVSPENLFIGTKYEVPQNSDLLHFTNFHGLLSILSLGFFRLSEFKNFQDKSEFYYSSDYLNQKPFDNLSQNQHSDLKNDLFAMSSCISDVKTLRNHFMWSSYADLGKGVCIEFDIKINNPRFTIGKIQYGNDELDIVKKLKSQTELFMKENENFHVQNIIQFFSTILSFHKSKKYQTENEVRIFNLRDRHIEGINYYKDLNSNFERINFCKIYHDIKKHPYYKNKNSESPYFNSIPKIELKNLILGYNLTYNQKVNIKSKLDEIKKLYNYSFKISHMNEEEEIIDITNT